MGMTMAEKVLARTAKRHSVMPGDYVTCEIDRIMAHEAFTLCARSLLEIGVEALAHPERVCVILDHYFPAPTERMARGHQVARQLSEYYKVGHFLGHAGICHQVLTEQGLVEPGMLVLGTDSHSTTYGAVGAAGSGIGLTEMTYVLATGSLWFQVPPTIRFALTGAVGPGIMSKDIILHLAGTFGTEVAQYKAIEFAGPVANQLSVASRMTMANMGIELGAKFAFFAADEVTRAYLAPRCGHEIGAFGPDADATYEADYAVDVSALEPQVACPHNPGNVVPVSQVGDVEVQQAFLGSCTNARLEDFAVAARILNGRTVHPATRLLVTPASQEVYLDALKAGYVETLARAGAAITSSGCGACPGGHQGVIAGGEACISSTNRNFKGRMGSPDGEVYLGSPATVAASAVTGRITDPREFVDAVLIGEAAHG